MDLPGLDEDTERPSLKAEALFYRQVKTRVVVNMLTRRLHMPGECVASIPRRHGSHEGKWRSHLGKYFFLMFLQ